MNGKQFFLRSTTPLKPSGWNESASLWEVFALLSTGLHTFQKEQAGLAVVC